MDLCAPAECVMLSIMKAKCVVDGCCAGRVLFMSEAGELVRFPSQLVELIVAYLLCWMLVTMSYRKAFRGIVYPWYLILYGATRFVLNFFRDEWAQYDGGMIPLGTVWSVCAVAIGLAWIAIEKKRRKETAKDVA